MNLIESISQNISARYDAMLQVREAKELIKALDSQWDDLMKEIEDGRFHEWMEFSGILTPEEGSAKKTRSDVIKEWEARNPQWEITGSGLRRRKTE